MGWQQKTLSRYEYCSCEKTLHGCNRTAADGPNEDGCWAASSLSLARE